MILTVKLNGFDDLKDDLLILNYDGNRSMY